jgi:hypothetical protein
MPARACVALALISAVACGGKNSSTPTPTSPTSSVATPQLADFVAGLQSLEGAAAMRVAGSRPTANGGPTVTATTQGSSSSTASQGGSSLVRLRADAPFSTVLMSAGAASVDGYYTLILPAATTETTVVVQFSKAIPGSTFQTAFSVQANGQTGATSSITNTVAPAATSARLELSFSPNPVPCVLAPPNAPLGSLRFRWPHVTFLRETNGVGLTITAMTASACRAGNCGPDVPAPASAFSGQFTGCRHAGSRIEANSVACTPADGFTFSDNPTALDLDETFIGTDDRGNRVTVTGRVMALACPQ